MRLEDLRPVRLELQHLPKPERTLVLARFGASGLGRLLLAPQEEGGSLVFTLVRRTGLHYLSLAGASLQRPEGSGLLFSGLWSVLVAVEGFLAKVIALWFRTWPTTAPKLYLEALNLKPPKTPRRHATAWLPAASPPGGRARPKGFVDLAGFMQGRMRQ